MHRSILLASTSLVASLAFVVGAQGAHANSCIDQKTGQVWDCNGPPPSQTQQPASTEHGTGKRAISAKTAPAPGVDRTAVAQRAEDASNRAENALKSAALTSDPVEKAQFKRAYEAAMRDIRQSTNDLINSTNDPAQKQKLRDALAASEKQHAAQASAAGIGSNPVPQQQATAPAAPANNTFSVCEEPKQGVTTCYEMGRTGDRCQEVWYQGGLKTLERGWTTCKPEDLKQRDAYFAGKPVGQGAPADPRSQQLADLFNSLDPVCRKQLESFLYNSRDSRNSRAAGDKAMKSFAELNSSAQGCPEAFARLAAIVGVGVPQRRLAESSRSAWAKGMADKPRETVTVPDVRSADSGSTDNGYYSDPEGNGGWNTGEVLNTGIQVLGVLGAILGGFAAGYAGGGGYSSGPVYSSAPSRGYGGPTGGGYVYRGGSSGGSHSTITGGSR